MTRKLDWGAVRALPWALWARQTAAVMRLELKRNLFAKRAWWIYLLALGPVLISGLHSLLAARGLVDCSMEVDGMAYAVMFQFFILRFAIFFGCVGIFSTLFRSEVLEKTLHYYFLSPVRREVLVVGKYLSGLAAAVILFGGGAALSFLAMPWHFGANFREFLFHGPGLSQLGWYTLVAVLASIGYGAVFLFMGLAFRNPMVPASIVMVWEAINFALPSFLKKISVIFYLKSLTPVDVPLRDFWAVLAVPTEPTPAYIAIPGLLLLALAILVYAGYRVRQFDVSYAE